MTDTSHICESSFSQPCNCIEQKITKILSLFHHVKEVEKNVVVRQLERAQSINRVEYARHSLLIENEIDDDAAITKILNASQYAVDNFDDVSLGYMQKIHQILEPGCPEVGVFRSQAVCVQSAFNRFTTTEPSKIEEELEQVVQMLRSMTKEDEATVIMTAMKAKVQFVMTHPFLDGNGRCSRILLVATLRKIGFPFVIILVDDITEYCGSLHVIRRMADYTLIYKFLLECIEKSLQMYLSRLE